MKHPISLPILINISVEQIDTKVMPFLLRILI